MEYKYKLSVAVVTYNHEKYLRRALDSVLAQQTDFDFEIVVGDDCSTDSSGAIIAEYGDKYPGRLTVLERAHNLGATKNTVDVYRHCQGKYIALIESDDFWTDTRKLQKQADFLDAHPDYSACTHRYSVVDENDAVTAAEFRGEGRPADGDYTLADFEHYRYFGHSGTCCFRNFFRESPQHDYDILWQAHSVISDITLCMILTLSGKVRVLPDNMSAYRQVHKKGGSNFTATLHGSVRIDERRQYLALLAEWAQREYGVKINYADRSGYYVWWALVYTLVYGGESNKKELKEQWAAAPHKARVVCSCFGRLFTLPEIALRRLRRRNKSKD